MPDTPEPELCTICSEPIVVRGVMQECPAHTTYCYGCLSRQLRRYANRCPECRITVTRVTGIPVDPGDLVRGTSSTTVLSAEAGARIRAGVSQEGCI